MRRRPRPNLNAAVDCGEWRQGDVFEVKTYWTITSKGKARKAKCQFGLAVVSQSCDAAQPSREEIQIAPVVELEDDVAEMARGGKRIAYAALPTIGPNFFADLTQIYTVPKTTLSGVSRQRGVTTDEQIRRFAGTLARRFGRFAFPDELIACMEPLKKALASKAEKEHSSLGKVLKSVYGIRMEASQPNGWQRTPYDLTLIVLLNPDARPTSDLPEEPKGLKSAISSGGKVNESRIADKILNEGTGDAERYWCYEYLAEAWVEKCMAMAVNKSVTNVIRSMGSEVLPVDEFTFDRVNVSEDIELDYLSEPLPSNRGLE